MNRFSTSALVAAFAALPLFSVPAQAPAQAPAPVTPSTAVAPQTADAPQTDSSRMLVDELPNGIKVVIEERHTAPVVHVLAYMKIGSIYEGEYLGSGLSHYMEHIVHGGSTRRQVEVDGQMQWKGRSEEETKRILSSIGGYTNAKTSLNYTQYFITTKSEMSETAIDLSRTGCRTASSTPAEVTREQGVVQQELLRNLDNAGRFRGQLYSETMFQVHPTRVPVIDYRDCIQRLTRDDMMAFYNRHYMPQNCVVSIVGAIDRYEMMEQVKRYFGTWKRKNREPYFLPEEPVQVAPRWVEKEHGSTKTCMVLFGVPTIPLRHPDLYALDMMSNVLGLGEAARLPRKFEHDPTREVHATQLGTSNLTPNYGCGRFTCGFTTDTPEDARKLVHEIWDEMNKLKTELVSEQEDRPRAQGPDQVPPHGPREGRRPRRAARLQPGLARGPQLRRPLPRAHRQDHARRRPGHGAQVSRPAEAQRHDRHPAPAQEAARRSHRHRGRLRRQKAKARERPHAAAPAHPRLRHGRRVDAFDGGVVHEDESNNGAFFLMGNTFWRGTKQRSFPQLMQSMDQLGMELGAESHNNVYFVRMQCLSSDLNPSFDILREVILEPAIDPAWIARLKMMLLQRVLPSQDVQAAAMMEKATRQTLYEKSPYRMQRFGTKESIQKLDATAIRKLYETYTRPNNCVMAIYGDIDLAATEQLVRKAFADWQPGEIPAKKSCPEPMPTKDRIVELTNRQVRTNYRIAWRAQPRQDEEARWAVSVLNTIIGGQGWLHERLRGGQNEYVYAVSARPYAGDLAGHYYIETDFDPADEKEVLAIIDGVIADACAGKFTDEDLELAKRQVQCYDALGKLENASVAPRRRPERALRPRLRQREALLRRHGPGHPRRRHPRRQRNLRPPQPPHFRAARKPRPRQQLAWFHWGSDPEWNRSWRRPGQTSVALGSDPQCNRTRKQRDATHWGSPGRHSRFLPNARLSSDARMCSSSERRRNSRSSISAAYRRRWRLTKETLTPKSAAISLVDQPTALRRSAISQSFQKSRERAPQSPLVHSPYRARIWRSARRSADAVQMLSPRSRSAGQRSRAVSLSAKLTAPFAIWSGARAPRMFRTRTRLSTSSRSSASRAMPSTRS
jgi:zinc protease